MRRVVFVDDEETLVWSLLKQGQMTRPDFVFDGFSDPVLAREAIQSNPPDVLVTDLRMPGLTGLDLLVAGPSTPMVNRLTLSTITSSSAGSMYGTATF